MPLSTATLHGLYVIADSSLASSHICLSDKVKLAIEGGARIVQIRDKRPTPDIKEIQNIARLCQQHRIPLLINDSIELAIEMNADGIHLGQSDTDLKAARQRLGDSAIIGITCHDEITLAKQAEAEGADYVAFGRFFSSQTKPEAPPANIKILQQARKELRIPIVAIGGITPDNGGSLLQAGADMLAVINGVFGQTDIKSAAQQFNQLFDRRTRNL